MKLSDYVAKFLANSGIKHVFGLTGGANLHLFDSLYRTKGITSIFTHHEQAAALAAEAYSRTTNNLGAAIVTTGPGGTNAITGVTAAWLDSLPCIFISGQSRFAHTSRGKPIRQLGSQELDIISLVTSVTKYAVMIDDPHTIKYHLQKALYLARNGRPGPVWIDIPLDFQWAIIDPDKLQGFSPHSKIEPTRIEKKLDRQTYQCYELLRIAKKPLILAGSGIRLAKAEIEFDKFIKKYKIPLVSSYNGSDLIANNHRLYLGRVGLFGQKGGNAALAECDLLLTIGSHLCLTITGLDTDAFAPNATKIMVDVDPVEIKFRMVKLDLAIQCDAKMFLHKLIRLHKEKAISGIAKWKNRCAQFKAFNSIAHNSNPTDNYVDPFEFIDVLSNELSVEDVIVVDGGGTNVYMSYQAFKFKKGQRLVHSSGLCAMGTGLPESIGACFANRKKRTICMIGDGSLQLNIHELQTIIHHKLPIKIIVWNNDGYLAIRHTQSMYLNGQFVGSSKVGGVTLPDYQKIASAYGMRALRINSMKEFHRKMKLALKNNDPVLCEVIIPPDQHLLSVK